MLVSVRHFFVLSFLSLPAFAFASDSALDILNDYFDSRAVCSVAEVRQLTENKNTITIHLEVEPSSREALLTMAPDSRDPWMALHCPPIGHEVWTNKRIKDFFVETPVDAAKPLLVSCRTYFDSVLQRRNTVTRSVAARIKELLGTNE